jgi:Zn-dependent protease
MTRTDRPLDNPINWSFRIGRFFGIDVRMHVTFVLGAAVLLWMEMPRGEAPPLRPWTGVLADAAGTYLLLFIIVLLHEFGHCFGARLCGGEADEILLWPLGGLASVQPPRHPRAHLITAWAGPMVNVALCGVASVVLAAWAGSLGIVPWNPIYPFDPIDSALIPTAAQDWVIRFYGLSYFLLLINLLPILPFDGGRIVQAWLWPSKGYSGATQIAAGVGMVGAIALGLFALFVEQSWLLLMMAAFGYVKCWQTRRLIREQAAYALDEFESMPSYALNASAEEEGLREPGFFERRRVRKAENREERRRRDEEQRRLALDQVLRKISESGMASLSAHERRVLDEATRRQREKDGAKPSREAAG